MRRRGRHCRGLTLGRRPERGKGDHDTGRTSGLVFGPVARKLALNNRHTEEGTQDILLVTFSPRCLVGLNRIGSFETDTHSLSFHAPLQGTTRPHPKHREAPSKGIMPTDQSGKTKEGDSLRNGEVCAQHPQSLQITDTHHRWPARLVFSLPPPPQ